MAGQQTLDLPVGVRVLSPQYVVPSSSGPGRGPLKAETRVRLPLGPPTCLVQYPLNAPPKLSLILWLVSINLGNLGNLVSLTNKCFID